MTLSLLSQVVNSYKKDSGSCLRHVNLVQERPGQICFSKRPITQCGPACKASGSGNGQDNQGKKEKTVQFGCLNSSSRMAELYKNKSIAEQNSLDIAWDILIFPKSKTFIA